MSIENEKKVRAKAYADLSLQFYKDKFDTGYFQVTIGDCDQLFNSNDSINYFIFSRNFAELEELTREEKLQVCNMFVRAKEIIEELDVK